MTGTCYYHPDQSAAETCVQCGMGICRNCCDRVAEKTVCRKCVSAVRSRLEQQMASGPASQNPSGSPAYAAAPGYARQNVAAADKPDAGKLLMAIILSLIIGIVASIVIEKILFYAHFGLSLLYIGMGYGIGFGLHRILGRGGSSMALLACGIMVISLAVGELFYVQDVIGYINEHGGGTATFTDALPVAMGSHGIMHWVCIVFGLLACYRGMEQQQS